MATFNEWGGTWPDETTETKEEDPTKEEVVDDAEAWKQWEDWAVRGPDYDDEAAAADDGAAADDDRAADAGAAAAEPADATEPAAPAAAGGDGADPGADAAAEKGGSGRATPPWRQPKGKGRGRGKGHGKHGKPSSWWGNKWKGQGHAHGGRGRNQDKATAWSNRGKGWKRPWEDHDAEWHDGASSSTSTCLVFYFVSICLPTKNIRLHAIDKKNTQIVMSPCRPS